MSAVPKSRYLVFVALAAGGFLTDMLSKRWVFQKLGMPPSGELWLWEPYFGLQTSLNRGALFGFGQGQVWLFATLSFVAALAICYWLFWAGIATDATMTTAFGLVMGGILGNLYDRLGLWAVPGVPEARVYAVRDWILLQWPPLPPWPNFNVADSLLVCGIGLLIVRTIFEKSPEKSGAPDDIPSKRANGPAA